MFNSQRTPYTLYHQEKIQDKFNQEVTDYIPVTEIQAFIGLNSHSNNFDGNGAQRVIHCEYVGVTSYRDIKRGDRIGDYIVKYVIPDRIDTYFYCERYE